MGTRRNMTSTAGPAPGKKSSPVRRQSANKKGDKKLRRKSKELAGKFGG